MKEIAIIFITVIVVLFAAAGCINLYKKKKYEKTLYFVQTGNPFNKVMQDIGLIGEYFTYQCLAPLNGYKKFIFNCYLPKADGARKALSCLICPAFCIIGLKKRDFCDLPFPEGRVWVQKVCDSFPNIQPL